MFQVLEGFPQYKEQEYNVDFLNNQTTIIVF